MKKLFLIDGSSYIYRAFYAVRDLSTSKGFPTNAVYGFLNMLKKVLKESAPDYIAVVYDSKGPTFRKEKYSNYKANRKEMPESLIPQIPYIKRAVDAYNIANVEKEGFEADDIIGTLVRRLKSPSLDIVIITGDKDLMQLVGENVKIFDTMKDKYYEVKDVVEKLGVMPGQVADIIALAGDSSDNIPGVSGIGEKTAIELINRFGSLEEVIERADEIEKPKLKENLKSGVLNAVLSKELATLAFVPEIDIELDDLAVKKPEIEALKNIFVELEFSKFLKELEFHSEKKEKNYRTVVSLNELDEIIDEIKRRGEFAVDTETSSEYPMIAELVGISISFKENEGYYIPLSHKKGGNLPFNEVLERLKPVLKDKEVAKIGQNIKYDCIVLKKYDLSVEGIGCDTMIASYLLNPSKYNHNLSDISLEYLNYKTGEYSNLLKNYPKNSDFSDVSVPDATFYSAEDADITYQLSKVLLKKVIKEGLEKVYTVIEMPLLKVLAEMETAGVKIDTGLFKRLSEDAKNQLSRLESTIFEISKEPFNINSHQQLGYILFEKLKLPYGKKTKTGYSTDSEVLTKLSAVHPLPEKVLEYRSLSKLKSTYLDSLPQLINPSTGRIHTSFNQTVTATGRLSSSEPNLQNIPIRTELGKMIRSGFIPEKGAKIISADYSQIELRILAHLSKDETLTDAFNKGEDIHLRTASEIFGTLPGLITGDMRREAKVINFGIIYGMGAFSLGKELGMSTGEAQKFIDRYFQRYPSVKSYLDFSLEEARKKGYTTTLFGRKRYLPELGSKNSMVRQFTERIAINTPIQGTAADIIKIAMININEEFKKREIKSKMIIQVHDELVFEVEDDEIEKVKNIVLDSMIGAAPFDIPVVVDLNIGNNWAEAH